MYKKQPQEQAENKNNTFVFFLHVQVGIFLNLPALASDPETALWNQVISWLFGVFLDVLESSVFDCNFPNYAIFICIWDSMDDDTDQIGP